MITPLRVALALFTVLVPLLISSSAQAQSPAKSDQVVCMALGCPTLDPIPDDRVTCQALGCQGRTSAVVRIAKSELAKNVSERNGNNVPRYNGGRGAIVPYALDSLPWDMTFASWVLQKAGYKQHLRGAPTMKIHGGGRAIAYTGAMTAAALKAGRVRQAPRPGYLAMYSDRHVEIVTRVVPGRMLVTVGGNTRDGVNSVVNPKGITHYIAPW